VQPAQDRSTRLRSQDKQCEMKLSWWVSLSPIRFAWQPYTMEPLKGIIRSCFKLGFGTVAERGHTIYFTNDKKYALLGPNQSPRGSEYWVVVWRPLLNHSFY